MRFIRVASVMACALTVTFIGADTARAENWPDWRGADFTSVYSGAALPLTWGPEKNIKWKTPVPHWGQSSPVIWGGRIFFTSQSAGKKSDPAVVFVECYDRKNGALLWRKEFAPAGKPKTNKQHNLASPSCVVDGQRIYAMFASGDAVCLDLDGEVLWKKALAADYGLPDLLHGHGSSPILYGDWFITHLGHAAESPEAVAPAQWHIVALDKHSGEKAWDIGIPLLTTRNSFGTPLVVRGDDGADTLLITANGGVYAYDLKTQQELWHVTELVNPQMTPSLRLGGGMVYVGSGFSGPMAALRLEYKSSSSRLAWAVQKEGVGVTSTPTYFDGLMISMAKDGIIECVDVARGEIIWREDLRRRMKGNLLSTPLVHAGRMYFHTTGGTIFVVEPGREFKLLHTFEMKDDLLGSATAADGELFLRSKNYIYCIAEGD